MKTTANQRIVVRLSSEIYRQLKSKCAAESMSMQDYVANMITNSLALTSFPGKDKGKDVKQRIFRFLCEFPILKGVDPAEIKKLADSSLLLHFQKNQTIVHEKDPLDSITIVADGLVKIFKTSASGKEFIIDVIRKGETFGEISIISGKLMAAGAQAMESTEIISIPKRHFLDFVSHHPDISTRINALVETEMCNLLGKISHLVSEKAEQRIAVILFELMRKFGNEFSFTHAEIAQMSGTTNETATRVMKILKNRGAVSLSRGKVQILDKDKLLST